VAVSRTADVSAATGDPGSIPRALKRMLQAQGYRALTGQSVDASIVRVPQQRNRG